MRPVREATHPDHFRKDFIEEFGRTVKDSLDQRLLADHLGLVDQFPNDRDGNQPQGPRHSLAQSGGANQG